MQACARVCVCLSVRCPSAYAWHAAALALRGLGTPRAWHCGAIIAALQVFGAPGEVQGGLFRAMDEVCAPVC